jgi:hypothetical protein
MAVLILDTWLCASLVPDFAGCAGVLDTPESPVLSDDPDEADASDEADDLAPLLAAD